jgi:hypothetical protein
MGNTVSARYFDDVDFGDKLFLCRWYESITLTNIILLK